LGMLVFYDPFYNLICTIMLDNKILGLCLYQNNNNNNNWVYAIGFGRFIVN